MSDAIQLSEIFEQRGFSDGVPKIDIVDAVYDEVGEVVAASTAPNLEMFFFQLFEEDADIALEDISNNIEEFEEIGYYRIYVLMSPDDSIHSAAPITDVSVQDDGRILLFI